MKQDTLKPGWNRYILYPKSHYKPRFWGGGSVQNHTEYCISKTGVEIHEIKELLTPTPKLIQTESGIRIENVFY
jgi:hypothetical protein